MNDNYYQDANEGAALLPQKSLEEAFDPDSEELPDEPFLQSVKSISAPIAQSSNFQAFLILFKSFIGCAVFTLPISFRNTGLGLSTIVTIFVGCLTLYCLDLAVKVADSLKGQGINTLEKLTAEVLGKKAKLSVQITLMIMQIGVCIGIFILGNQFLDYSLCVYNIENLCRNTIFKVGLFAGITIPLSIINNAHYFFIPSLIGGLFVLITMGSQVFYNIQLISNSPTVGETAAQQFQTWNWTQLPLLFGVATYAFEGIGTLFSIRGAMAKQRDFPKLLSIEIVVLISLLVSFGLICSIALGNDLPEIVLFALPRDNTYYLVVQIGIVISNLVSYPIQFFPAVVILENTRLIRHALFDNKGQTKNRLLRYGLRFLIISIMILIAFLAKSFNLFLNILGSCVFTYVGFILPIWLYHVHFKKIPNWRRVVNYIVVVISVILGSIGTVMAIIKLVNYQEEIYL